MAHLTEHQAKAVLARWGLPVPSSVLVESEESAVLAAERLGGEVVVKAQVPAGGRGKAGGVRVASVPSLASAAFAAVTSVAIDGLTAVSALVEPRLEVAAECYLAIVLDGEARGPVLLFGAEGGMEVESAAPPLRLVLRDDGGVSAAAFRRAAYSAGVAPDLAERVLSLAGRLAAAYRALDAQLIEVNPLGVTAGGDLVALDARLVVDDHALFRQPELAALVKSITPRPEADLVRERTRLEFVRLGGSLGLISGGAGMTMAVMDLIDELGASPACFLDCSANPTLEGYGAGLDLLLEDPGVKAVLVSIFGGLTHVDRVARTLVSLIQLKSPTKPITIRLMGTHVEAAEVVLAQAGLRNIRDLRSAVAQAVSTLERPAEDAG